MAADEGVAVAADDAVEVGVIGEDRRGCLEVGVTAPGGALLGDDLDVGRQPLLEALLLQRVGRVARRTEDDRDVAAVGQ